MAETTSHQKLVRHYDEPGQARELTFSCYLRMPLLTNDDWRRMLSRSIDAAMNRLGFRLVAFAYMPEHVHILVFPFELSAKVERLLKAIKQPFSFRIKQKLIVAKSRLLERLTVQERPGKFVFRFWQEGPGYDRNLLTADSINASIDYIHMNPVRRGLVKEPGQWKWSSYRWYMSDGTEVDEDLPRIDRLPVDFWNP